ncbi:MAG TPA: winged helix-turn-helix domain-containing protein [Pseudonocardiaceae bacterium]|nr:winged helix-turn-helix domain-containing protein [Pseudonocardiaceae bacterium]
MREMTDSVDRSQIGRHVWGHDHSSGSNVTDIYIGYLRRKLDTAGHEPIIHTVRGSGTE